VRLPPLLGIGDSAASGAALTNANSFGACFVTGKADEWNGTSGFTGPVHADVLDAAL
jgi:hypothetical protein